jgi:hypothetical protein
MERYFAICSDCGLAVMNRQENHKRYGECQKEQDKKKGNNIYTINLTFTTDRPLSDIEVETLKSQLIAQIEEPVTEDGDDVDYTTNLIEVK